MGPKRMIKLKPTLNEFIADTSLYSLYHILPVGWKKVNDETTKVQVRLCAKEKRRQQIERMKYGVTNKDLATLTFEREAIGPFRERKVLTYGDGRVLTMERVYESWELEEFWQAKKFINHKMSRNDRPLVEDSESLESVSASIATASTSISIRTDSIDVTSSILSGDSQKRRWWSWPVLKTCSIVAPNDFAGRLFRRRCKPQQRELTEQESISRFWRNAQREQELLAEIGLV